MSTDPTNPGVNGPTLLATSLLYAAGRRTQAQASRADDPWPSLAAQFYSGRPLCDGSAIYRSMRHTARKMAP